MRKSAQVHQYKPGFFYSADADYLPIKSLYESARYSFELDTRNGNYSKGMYMVKYKSGDRSRMVKLMVK